MCCGVALHALGGAKTRPSLNLRAMVIPCVYIHQPSEVPFGTSGIALSVHLPHLIHFYLSKHN